MTAIERETYINFSDADEIAMLCTFNSTWLRRMDKLAQKSFEVTVKVRRDDYGEYLFPKKFLKVNLPVNLSENEREKRSQRARENFHR